MHINNLIKLKMKVFLLVLLNLLIFNIKAQVSPFLTTTWNQTCYYNEQCPTVGSGGDCGHAFTGCNATAWGQIMKYYAFPSTTMGTVYCNTNAPTYCVDFSSQTYDFNLMPNNVSSSKPEVAKLLYQIGVAQDMQWSNVNSTSYFDVVPLKRYFKYSPKMYASATFLFPTTADLIAAIKNELDHGRPVYAKGGNHFYLIDGYNASNQFHMNFGWGGTYNGYYDITNITNGAGTFTPSNFQFNIMPMSGDLEVGNDTIFVNAAGTLKSYEFTSLLAWTTTTNQSWINLNLTSGNTGYFNNNDGANITCNINNDTTRIGKIFIQNANDTDTFIVVQDASPLNAHPEPLNYSSTGGIQTLTVDYSTWSVWNLPITDTWLTASSYSDAGGSTVDITCSSNPTPASRSAWLIFTASSYTDSVLVTQAGSVISPYLNVSVDSMWFNYNGGSQDITIDINADSVWQINLLDTWLSSPTLTGIGPSTVTINCDLNSVNSPRNSWVMIEGVGLTDSIYVSQEEQPLSVNKLSNNGYIIYQQNNILYLSSSDNMNASIYNLQGQKVGDFNQNQFNFETLAKGIYVVVFKQDEKITTQKIRID